MGCVSNTWQPSSSSPVLSARLPSFVAPVSACGGEFPGHVSPFIHVCVHTEDLPFWHVVKAFSSSLVPAVAGPTALKASQMQERRRSSSKLAIFSCLALTLDSVELCPQDCKLIERCFMLCSFCLPLLYLGSFSLFQRRILARRA